MHTERKNLFIITAILVAMGIVAIYTSSAIYAHEIYGDSTYFLKRHLVFLGIGLMMMTLTLAVPYGRLRRIAKPLLCGILVLLVLVLLPPFGREIGGAHRWFRIGPFGFQPSEAAEIVFLIYLADLLARKKNNLYDFREGVLPGLLVLGLFVGLIFLQPDFGTAMAIATVALFMFSLAGVKMRYLSVTMASFLPISFLYIALKPHALRRILAFLAPENDPLGAGFQIIQSYVALGSGGLFGVGLGQSKQKLFYLPAAHTDFIFSIIGEELGLLGTGTILLLFFLFTWNCYQILRRVQDRFGRLLGFGIASLFTLEALVNMGVACGLLPTKGLPLPFVSYGGSALIFNLIGVGLLLNISRYGKESSSPFSNNLLEAGEFYFVPKGLRFQRKGRRS